MTTAQVQAIAASLRVGEPGDDRARLIAALRQFDRRAADRLDTMLGTDKRSSSSPSDGRF